MDPLLYQKDNCKLVYDWRLCIWQKSYKDFLECKDLCMPYFCMPDSRDIHHQMSSQLEQEKLTNKVEEED